MHQREPAMKQFRCDLCCETTVKANEAAEYPMTLILEIMNSLIVFQHSESFRLAKKLAEHRASWLQPPVSVLKVYRKYSHQNFVCFREGLTNPLTSPKSKKSNSSTSRLPHLSGIKNIKNVFLVF